MGGIEGSSTTLNKLDVVTIRGGGLDLMAIFAETLTFSSRIFLEKKVWWNSPKCPLFFFTEGEEKLETGKGLNVYLLCLFGGFEQRSCVFCARSARHPFLWG